MYRRSRSGRSGTGDDHVEVVVKQFHKTHKIYIALRTRR
jgi:hypothetical protein